MKKRSRTWLWICVGYLLAFALFCWACHAAGKMLVNEKEAEKPSHVERCLEEEAAAQAASRARAKRLAAEAKAVGCSWTYTLEPGECVMSARGTQQLGVAYGGKLNLVSQSEAATPQFYPNMPAMASFPPVKQLKLSCGVGTVEITYYNVFRGAAQTAAPGPPPAFMWSWQGYYYVFLVKCEAWSAGSPPGTKVDFHYYALHVADGWCYGLFPNSTPPNTTLLSTDDYEADWTLTLVDAYRRGAITQTLPSGQSGLRHPCQRTGTGVWYGDGDTKTQSAIGGLSAEGSFTNLTEVAVYLPLTLTISYYIAPTEKYAYGWITLNNGSDDNPVASDLSPLTFYKDDDNPTTWHWHGVCGDPSYTPPTEDESEIHWATVPSGNTLTIHRYPGIASGAVDFAITGTTRAVRVTPRLWKQNKDAE